MFLLDTNACIHLLNASHPAVTARFGAESPASIRLCSVVKAELIFGARKSTRVARVLTALERFFRPLLSVPFDDECAHEYGRIRADLDRAGTPIGGNDLMIAAIARRYDLTVVTHNIDEFTRVAGLAVEDWEAA